LFTYKKGTFFGISPFFGFFTPFVGLFFFFGTELFAIGGTAGG
jgi:hypothetical protein